jgi:PEGA domain
MHSDLAGRLHPEPALATDDPFPGASSIEPGVGAQAPTSDLATRSDREAWAPSDDGVDSLLLFPSETEVDGGGLGVPESWTYEVPVGTTVTQVTGRVIETRTTSVASRIPDPQTIELFRNLEGRLGTLAGLNDLCRSIDERLVRAEHALQRTEDRASDHEFLDRCTRIDERLGRTEDALQTVQGAVVEIDKTLHELCANIVKGSDGTEEVLRRMEAFVADRTLHQLAARIDTRLADTTAEVQQIERLVGGGELRELSAGINGRLVRTEETLRRIERMLQAAGPGQVNAVGHQSAPAMRAVRLGMERARNAVVTCGRAAQPLAAYVWNRVNQITGRINARRVTARVAGVLLLLGVLSLVSVRLDDPGIRFNGTSTSGDRPVPPVQAMIPAVEAAPLAAPQKTPIAESRPLEAPPVSGPRRASTQRPPRETASAKIAATRPAPPAQYVGTLEIESKPSGAAVFLNGRAVGVTPLKLSRQRAGSLALQLTHKGFKRWSAAVQVRSGVSTEVTATLLPDGP